MLEHFDVKGMNRGFDPLYAEMDEEAKVAPKWLKALTFEKKKGKKKNGR